MSAVTWGRVEDGKGVHAATYVGVERALGWPLGTIARYVDTGEEPPAPTSGETDVAEQDQDIVESVLDGPYPDAVKVLLVKALRSDGDPVDALLDAAAPDGDKIRAIRALRELRSGGSRASPARSADRARTA